MSWWAHSSLRNWPQRYRYVRPNLEDAIDEVFEIARHGQTQMALEDDPIEAVQRADNQAGKLDHEATYCGHGILPRLVDVRTNHSAG